MNFSENMYYITTLNNASVLFGPCPDRNLPLQESINAYKEKGIELVISLLKEHEISELNLEDEEKFCLSVGISYLHLPITDMSIPSLKRFSDFIELLYKITNDKKMMYIHCLHGIGRSSLVTAGLLIRSGIPIKEALKLIADKRGLNVPETFSQKKLLSLYEKSIGNS